MILLIEEQGLLYRSTHLRPRLPIKRYQKAHSVVTQNKQTFQFVYRCSTVLSVYFLLEEE